MKLCPQIFIWDVQQNLCTLMGILTLIYFVGLIEGLDNEPKRVINND
jgi:hypothetical protein